MSAFAVGSDLIHYEVLGRGRQVVFVHGWIGSWRYWIPTLQQLQAKYRVYALDLYGFGDTAKNANKYTLEHQIELLADFMRELGMPKAAFVGHGLGALVVAEFARRYPDRVPRLMLIDAPLFDPGDLDRRVPQARKGMPSTGTLPNIPSMPPGVDSSKAAQEHAAVKSMTPSPGTGKLKALTANRATIAALVDQMRVDAAAKTPAPLPIELAKPAAPASMEAPRSAPTAMETAEHPRLIFASNENPLEPILTDGEALLAKAFKKSEPEYGKLHVDVAKSDPRAIREVSSTFDSGRMVDTLRLLTMPVAVVHGMDDPIISPPSDAVWQYVTTDKENLLVPIPLPNVRHFPMLEYDLFPRLLTDFLEAPDVSRLEIKERWKRRSR